MAELATEDPHQLVAKLSAHAALAYIIATQPRDFTWDITVSEMWIAEVFGVPRTELDRRRRELNQKHGWVIVHAGYRNRFPLFRADHVGDYLWHPGYLRQEGTGAKVRQHLNGDGTCSRCGMSRDGRTGAPVKLTVGRVLPGALGGAYVAENCRYECVTCNSGQRDRYPRVETVPVPAPLDSEPPVHQRLRLIAVSPPALERYSIHRDGKRIA